jgi:endogenous inhibitor of DNA gyrase (YacG/DUF329 family)
MSEQVKVKCPTCGKTIAMQDEDGVYIKCTGKHEGHKCGCINKIPK